jgi:PPK2 family polyphosphate:nucleotide phosphotransferase
MTSIHSLRVTKGESFSLKQFQTTLEPLYSGKKDFREEMEERLEEVDDLQTKMYAHDRYGLLLIFQAMDAAGKDGTIKDVMSGVNPHGVVVSAFKKPSDNELDHDFMWRTNLELPQRGRIGIHNRSWYEEVLVVKVHPEILTRYQRLPAELVSDPEKAFDRRYHHIRNHESYLYDEGIRVVKFFLHLSRAEQARRFLERLDTPSKNWKFAEGDVKERGFWNDYQKAYEKAIQETASEQAPWYVIPADDKKNMRLLVVDAILQELRALNLSYPVIDEVKQAEFEKYRTQLLAEIAEDEG